MKHLCLLASLLSLLLAGLAGVLLATGHTALISPAGLVKVVVAAVVVAAAGLVARWLAGRVERRRRERWVVSAHPVTWLLALVAIVAAVGLAQRAWRQAQAPSLHGNWSIGIYLSAGAAPTDFAPLGDQPVLTAAQVDDLPCAFVADPVLVREGGRYVLFFEAWNTRTGQGDICVATSADGRSWNYGGQVLDESCSLSYPTVFAHEGTWYMIPESRELDELRLYRAERFPDAWVLDRVLLSGAPYRDTNVIEHEGRWYLLTIADYGGGLLVYHAEDPRGPWRAHPANPVLQGDPDHTRGGGSLLEYDGRLLRFVQDVTPYYGNRVRAAEVSALTPTAYDQIPADGDPVLVGHDSWNVRGMHTLWCVRRDDGRWLAAVDGHGVLMDTKPLWRD